MDTDATDVAVIGAGPGGYAAAFYAADLGKRVTLIDSEPNPGGVCLYYGCIPSKALLHAAAAIDGSRRAATMGIRFGEPRIALDQLRAWKDSVVQRLTRGLGQIARQRAVHFVQGHASILDARTLNIRTADGSGRRITFEHAILATGSRPATVPGLSIDSPRVLDSTSALDLPDVPERLLIIGGGYIGLELGTVYAALGTKVTIVEMTAGLLPGADRDLVAILARRVEKI
jgi:dihydrolipoamide dehydrogenase